MYPDNSNPSSTTACLAIAIVFCLYVICLYSYRLLLHPLAKFPGPKLAAATNWYEFYYDVIQQGAFTSHIKELHDRYGPIIRITPTEIHVDDPDYYSILYERSGRLDKYAYMSGRFGFASDSSSTVDHETHRMRRKALNLFSDKKISDFQPVIRKKVAKFGEKLAEYQRDGRILPLDSGWMALTTDTITEYAFGRAYNQLDSPDFQDTMEEALLAIYSTGQFALHFPIVFPILDSLPDWFVMKVHPVLQPVVGLRKDLGLKVREIRDGVNQAAEKASHPTIFHEILNSDLPDAEKTDARLGDEAQLIVAAGLVTTSRALSVASYHITANPSIQAKLRAVLSVANFNPQSTDWHKLEELPYLHGCVHEAIRLGHGSATRSPRLAPDTELRYDGWVIPKNTPVSMSNVHVLMNESIFPEPRKFSPERWIGNPGLQRYFVPFTKGSRQCLGLNLAKAEMYIIIATIFTSFEFELFETDISDVEMAHAYLVPYPKWDSKGIRMRVKPGMSLVK
ncbi:hypothetical protein EG328_003678 [Venturia inaequalis]|uniref:Cytochrome P450 n=1 Tax=Venturia inaequalis TaxID=5025 RepID=A0A8H3USU4_VENIN|nr:hypothetical protein EG328_003678 [Venturia inaequalis]KAE9994202.1 hypothetical protein EG327_000484 [Venturia inaequalis]RDI87098.1 hypothetical protein Vi05172_g2738 [Venturia inaequalis]